jgi:hypothetical protein
MHLMQPTMYRSAFFFSLCLRREGSVGRPYRRDGTEWSHRKTRWLLTCNDDTIETDRIFDMQTVAMGRGVNGDSWLHIPAHEEEHDALVTATERERVLRREEIERWTRWTSHLDA